MFDKDGSGHIDPAELRRVFTRLGENLLETELEDQLREVDIDGDLMVSIIGSVPRNLLIVTIFSDGSLRIL